MAHAKWTAQIIFGFALLLTSPVQAQETVSSSDSGDTNRSAGEYAACVRRTARTQLQSYYDAQTGVGASTSLTASQLSGSVSLAQTFCTSTTNEILSNAAAYQISVNFNKRIALQIFGSAAQDAVDSLD
jgi:hypothetical protein